MLIIHKCSHEGELFSRMLISFAKVQLVLRAGSGDDLVKSRNELIYHNIIIKRSVVGRRGEGGGSRDVAN